MKSLTRGITLQPAGGRHAPSLFDWKSRIGRAFFVAYSFGAALPPLAAMVYLNTTATTSHPFLFAATVFAAALLVIASFRRLRDVGYRGWACPLALIPMLNIGLLLYLAFMRGTDGPNPHGHQPSGNSGMVLGCALLFPTLAAICAIILSIRLPGAI